MTSSSNSSSVMIMQSSTDEIFEFSPIFFAESVLAPFWLSGSIGDKGRESPDLVACWISASSVCVSAMLSAEQTFEASSVKTSPISCHKSPIRFLCSSKRGDQEDETLSFLFNSLGE